jgi:DNA-binding transcriptional ArsR family regulator
MECRVHLTPADVGKVRLSPRPSPVIETSGSAALLRRATTDPFVRRWRVRAAQALGPAAAQIMQVVTANALLLSDLLHRHALTANSYEDALEAFLITPKPIIRRDLAHIFDLSPEAARGVDLYDGNRNAMEAAAANLLRYHRAVIDPQWQNSVRHGHAVFTAHRHHLAENGVDWLLRNLHPNVHWDPPVLTIYPGCPNDHRLGSCPYHFIHELHRDFFLQGRGLVLVPSLFAPFISFGFPDFDDRPAVLIYPANSDRTALEGPGLRRPGQLGPLLGATRAAVMDALGGQPRSTSELARVVGISLASASQHAAVLRSARLISSTRQGGSVIHSITASGAALLEDAN